MNKISSNTPGVSNFVKMEVAEIRSVIKYFVIKGLKQKEIYDELCQTLGDACPSQTTVYKWAGLFKRGRRSVDNDPPPVAPR